VPALAPKASSSAGIKGLMFCLSAESARPVVSSVHERYEDVAQCLGIGGRDSTSNQSAKNNAVIPQSDHWR
jgi:hypothetical protein